MFGFHRWKEAIAVAENQKHPDVETLKRSHFEWLLETGQASFTFTNFLLETTIVAKTLNKAATSSDRNMSWEY